MHRIGFGYDSHRFADGRPLVLGGVVLDHPQGLTGHSDGDAILHAVTDAILGAMAAGDIGELFPDTDPAHAGADSAGFVAKAMAIAADKGFAVVNCDVTVIAESPKLSPHKAAIAARIAELLGISPDAVGVKGKSNEQMGFIGRGEGLATMAAVLLSAKN